MLQMNKIIIAGSREFSDYNLLEREVKKFIVEENIVNPIIISGIAKGADKLGEDFAKKFKLNVELYPADWDSYGKRAGFLRNEQMAKCASHCIVFWDGDSKGTGHMIDLANKYNLKLKVINFGST